MSTIMEHVDERSERQGAPWKEEDEGAASNRNENTGENVSEFMMTEAKLEPATWNESGNIVVVEYDWSREDGDTSSVVKDVTVKEENDGLTPVTHIDNAYPDGSVCDVTTQKVKVESGVMSYEDVDVGGHVQEYDSIQQQSSNWKNEDDRSALCYDSGGYLIDVGSKVKVEQDATYESGRSASENVEVKVRSDSGNILCQCSNCDFTSSEFSLFERHLSTHTGEKPYVCNHCNYRCSSRADLKIHIGYHTGETPFTCNYCDYTCSIADLFKKHVMTHKEDKTYACCLCKYKGYSFGNLNDHMTTHANETLFACNDCDFVCKSSSHLKRHMKTHTVEKPYVCNHCNYRCSSQADLKVHIGYHTGETPFMCNYCDYTSCIADLFKKHVMTHKGEET